MRSHNRFSYYPNANATFNILLTSGDIELNPGPTTQECNTNNPQRHTIPVISGTQQSGPRSNRPPADLRIHRQLVNIPINYQLSNQQHTDSSQTSLCSKVKKHLNIAHLNIQSLNRQHHAEPRHLLYSQDFDILSLSETWLNSSNSNASIRIPGYNLYRLDRLTKGGGGVCVYARNGLKVTPHKDLSSISPDNFHQLWIQCQQRKLRSLVIGVVYRPPDCPISCLSNHLSPMNYVLTLNKDIVLLGDLNCDMLKNDRHYTALDKFCVNYNLKQIIDKPTCVTENSKTLIDVIILSILVWLKKVVHLT
jgi:exonuclease III